MRTGYFVFAAVITAFGLAACAPTQDVSSVAMDPVAMDPIEHIKWNKGDTFVWETQSGKFLTYQVTSVEDGVVSMFGSDGCGYSFVDGHFAQPVSWSNCGGSTGTATLQSISGEIYPLAVGNSAAYAATGVNDKGNTWDATRECTVIETTTLTVPAGTFDAMVVECKTGNDLRTSFMTPGLPVPVRATRSGDNGWDFELVSFTPGA